MDGYRPATYGDAFADVYDDWYADVSPPEATAAFVHARLPGPGAGARIVVELGSGTGRLAVPLAARSDVTVVGLDASAAMLARARARDASVPVVAADMAEPPLRAGVADAVLVAFNTLFNLPTRSLQRTALQEAAALCAPDGIVVLEAFVPGDGAGTPSDRVDVVRLETDLVVLRVSRTDPDAGTVSGHHVELRDGAPVRLRPWHLRFAAPDELDRMAAAAGLTLDERYGDWHGAPFGPDSDTHVSVYRARQARQ